MKFTLLAVALALLWGALSGSFSGPNLLLGLVVAALALALLHRRSGGWRRVGALVMLAGSFACELMASAIQVALLVLTPNLRARLQPAIVAVPLTVRSDLEITLLANMITLTPGTLTIDVSDDRSMLYVHVLLLKDRASLIEGIAQGFEKRLLTVFA